jgi:hypothetical protein
MFRKFQWTRGLRDFAIIAVIMRCESISLAARFLLP